MKHRIIWTACAVLSFGVAGCSSSQPNQESQPSTPPPAVEVPSVVPTQQGERQEGPEWKIAFHSKCKESELEHCLGHFGFSVSADGNYQVGPGPNGQLKQGSVSSDELQVLKQSLAGTFALLQDSAERQNSCVTHSPQKSEDQVELSRQGSSRVIYHSETEQTCALTLQSEDAQTLVQAVRGLAKKYYELPFPNICADAIAATEALYANVQTCAMDSDCAYVNAAFEPIPPASTQFVTTNSCSLLKPLAVGNIKSIVNQSAQLLAALNLTQEKCGTELIDSSCMGYEGFQSTAAPAVCDHGSCRVHPTLLGH